MSRPNRRPAQASANEAYRRALLLPVQPWKRQWVAPVGGSPGLKLMQWVKSDDKLQWSDDEDDYALEQALGAAAEHGAAGAEGEEGEAGSDDDDEESHEPGDVTPIDGGSFPASGIQTPKEPEARPHPLSMEVKMSADEDEGEDGDEGEEGEEGEEEDKAGVESAMDVEPGAEEGEEEDADLNVPAPTSAEFDAPGPGFPGHEVDVGADVDVDVEEGELLGEEFPSGGFDHLDLGEVAHKELIEGEDVFDHEGGIEEALGQEPLGLVNADNPEDVFS
ncbi:hypothetical protein CALCODRAFT_482846 [Calocera cornea HHB12733]|uniref:Uncharacterized protein n=1 Tax=Calocera cornea HHB12733 TaxID=1353952 RepID=A0A165GBB4_9BASI|nr:hypothetical protein CALCODRAFT_482846 [Calocera cornea HHB12733]